MEGQRWFAIREAAIYAGVSVHALRHAIWSADLPRAKVGRKFILDKLDLDRWLEGLKCREGAGN